MAWSDVHNVTPGFLAGLLVGVVFMALMPSLTERGFGGDISREDMRWKRWEGGTTGKPESVEDALQETGQEMEKVVRNPSTAKEIRINAEPNEDSTSAKEVATNGELDEGRTNAEELEATVRPLGGPENATEVLQSAGVSTSAKEVEANVQPECHDWVRPQENGEAGAEDPWLAMKWVDQPSLCPVRGHTIEMLDPVNNFRRGWALDFAGDVEDRSLLPAFFLASQDTSLQTRKRRVLLDLGGKNFESSTAWFLRQYPLDFTEVHAFEMQEGRYRIPRQHPAAQDAVAKLNGASRTRPKGDTRNPAPIPNWMLTRIKSYQVMVTNEDGMIEVQGKPLKKINITRFMKEDLGLTPDDAVIVKMDIEGSEWDVLPEWAADPEMVAIVDEIFVEVHYQHPSMSAFGWRRNTHDRETATRLLSDLRSKGLFVHFWT
eukprot:TRINITY_DN1284_c0_g1_i1.p1 TRINITY_DN1284_c0_g1~~TRINITY_DN1284_c0_g1_i1.p1  ORF type:complete len:432 (+),score=63.33 TRINITY_DN1284_c0_g1_i1:198-1493(+)